MSEITYLNRQYVEIDAGTIAESTDPDLVGTHRLFVTYVDEQGGRMCFWDGVHHADAVLAAHEWARDHGTPIVDRTGPCQ